jgi:hypothetical protein
MLISSHRQADLAIIRSVLRKINYECDPKSFGRDECDASLE